MGYQAIKTAITRVKRESNKWQITDTIAVVQSQVSGKFVVSMTDTNWWIVKPLNWCQCLWLFCGQTRYFAIFLISVGFISQTSVFERSSNINADSQVHAIRLDGTNLQSNIVTIIRNGNKTRSFFRQLISKSVIGTLNDKNRLWGVIDSWKMI